MYEDVICRPDLSSLPAEIDAGLREGRYKFDLSQEIFQGVIRDRAGQIVKWVDFRIVDAQEITSASPTIRQEIWRKLAPLALAAVETALRILPAGEDPSTSLPVLAEVARSGMDQHVVIPLELYRKTA